MKNLRRFGTFMFLGTAVSLLVISCHKSDEVIVTPPTVAVVNSISGRVTSISGDAISGATVTMDGSTTATTASNGTFTIANVTMGDHAMKASASGKVAVEGTVNVASSDKGTNAVWEAALANEGVAVTYNASGEGTATVSTETAKGNEQAKIATSVTVPKNAVSDPTATIKITPVYSNPLTSSKSAYAVSRATASDILLASTAVTCSNSSATITTPLSLTYEIDASIISSLKAKKLVNGAWTDATATVDGTKITISVTAFTTYALFLNVSTSTAQSTETLTFTPSQWDNLYGSKDITVDAASYSYKIGTSLPTASNKLSAYLIEILTRETSSSLATVTGTYPINITLPVGTALNIYGTQTVTTYTVSAFGSSVSGKNYGAVSIATSSYNRQHTGGSN